VEFQKRVAAIILLVAMVVGAFALAGCTQKEPLTIDFYTYTNPRPYNPVGDKLAEAIQQQLQQNLGAVVNIHQFGWTEYKDEILSKGNGQMYLFGWIGDNGDPDNFLFVHFHSSQIGALNAMGYKNPQVDDLLTQAQKESDPQKRDALYKQADQLIVQDAPWVFISHANDMVATRKNVTGFVLYPTGSIFLQNVDKEVPAGQQKVLVYARGADSLSLDPALIDDGESAKVIENIYDTLVTFEPGTTKIKPALATDWKISDDGLVYTFYLRKGVKFHDGTPFNADAVVASIGRQVGQNATADMPYASFTFGDVDKVEKVDDYTVKITLKEPNAPFLLNLAMGPAAPIVSPTALKKYGADFGHHPVGTGPFIFEKWDPDQQIVLKANPNYWGGKPKVDEVIFKVTKDNTVRAQELLAGSVDIIDGIDPADVDSLKNSPDINFLSGPGMNINYLAFRVDRPPFDNPKVRQAVSMAIDRQAIVDSLYKGIAVVANGPLPPGMLGYDPNLKPYEYNPAEAKKLLAEAGYKVPK